MLISTSKKRGLLKMLITVIITLVLCTSGLLLIQKPTQVSASGQLSASTQVTQNSTPTSETSDSENLPISKATAGSSAVLKGNTEYASNGHYITCWLEKLASPVTKTNIVSVRITTDSSKITDFTQGVNVKDDTSENDLYYYYKANSSNYEIVIYADVEKIYAPVCCYELFASLTNCKSIIFDNFDTSNVTDMKWMFYNCSSLTSLNVSNFNTSNVTDMSYMFRNCSSLTNLDLSNFNTSNVTSMTSMFSGCSSLTSLNVTNFDTSKVTDMILMFFCCSSLTSLDLSSFNTSKVTDMSQMFDVCESLKTLTLGSNFKTSNVTAMNDMFSQCFSLKSLNVSNFDTSKVTNMARMFWGCIGLKKLDISNFSFASITSSSNIEMMFGLSYEQVAQMFGLDVETFVNASFEEKVEMGVTASGYSEDYARSLLKKCGSIPCIVAPSNLNGLTITIPGEYNYTDGGEAVTSVLLAGKTHTLASASTDTSDTGIISDSILLSLIALCFVFSGFMMLKKKKVR